ncbi:MAG: cation transporter [Bacteroidales bacterium]|nr:cation transporter [Bacteroidales bacterium]
MDRKKDIVKASWISVFGNALLSALKIIVGFISGSLAVLGDGLDSASDIVTSLITLITAKIVSRPPNAKYAYGYEKADTIASKVLAFLIFFAGAQLFISTTKRLILKEVREMPGQLAIYITIVSIIGKLLLSLYQFKVGKKANSAMLIANAKNMRNDVVISVTVLLGLIFTFVLKLPVIDSAAALAVSIWIMKVGFDIFMETNTELMDGINDPSVYKIIIEAAEMVEGVKNPHRIRSREMGGMYEILLDIEVDGSITLDEAHEIAHAVERSIREKVENVYEIIVHAEPFGDKDNTEKFGLSRKNIGECE